MITNRYRALPSKLLTLLSLMAIILCYSVDPVIAQNQEQNRLQSLRSDVGIIGLKANFMSLNSFERLGTDSTTTPLQNDGSNELEFVLRNVRMISPRLGVGFELLTSFFTNDADGEPSFGIGSWGLGPVLRAYPFKTDRFQPYAEANALFGNNMAVGDLADTERQGGFRVRLGLRGGAAFRITNRLGLFIEAGPDWESGRLFKADARTLQINFGIDIYRFN